MGVVTGCRDDCISAAPVDGVAAGRETTVRYGGRGDGRDAQRSLRTACVHGTATTADRRGSHRATVVSVPRPCAAGRGGGRPEVACARPPTTGADRHRPEPTAAVDAAIRPALPTNRRRARSPAFSLHLFGRGYSLARRAHTGTRNTHAPRRSVHYNSYSSARRCSSTSPCVVIPALAAIAYVRATLVVRTPVRSLAVRPSQRAYIIRAKHFALFLFLFFFLFIVYDLRR